MSKRAPPASLADLVEQQRDELVREWTALAASELGERLEGPELRDGVPALLDAVVSHLRAGSSGWREAVDLAQRHGEQRLRFGVDLRRLLHEYRLLGQIIARSAERAGLVARWGEVRALDEVLAACAAEAGAQYAEQRTEVERDLEAHFREVANHTPGAVFVKGSDGRYQFVNRWAAALFGLTERELVGRTAREILPPSLADQVEEHERRVAVGEEVVSEDVVPTPHGERVLITVRFPYRLRSGQHGIVAIAVDITDRKRAEREAQHAAELLELGDAFLELDRDWRVVRVNANQERLSRRPRSETLGRVFWELWPEVAHPGSKYWTEYHRTMEQRVPVQFEEYYAPLDLWTEVTAYPVSGNGLAMFFRDATERKEWEDRLHRAREFEQHLLGIVSHDLRTPLGTILTSAQLLTARDDLDDRAVRIVARIAAAADRATRMISDLLELGAARLGQRVPVTPVDMDLGVLADEVVQEVALSFPDRRVEVRREGDLRGRWDRDRLAQLLTNLVTNALKYGAPREPVDLETRGDENAVVIRVRNGGAPIPPEALPHVFEPLRARDERWNGSEHGAQRSVGLGLFIVREIATAHGGTVDVASTPESGTTFTVRVPRDPGGVAAAR